MSPLALSGAVARTALSTVCWSRVLLRVMMAGAAMARATALRTGLKYSRFMVDWSFSSGCYWLALSSGALRLPHAQLGDAIGVGRAVVLRVGQQDGVAG